MNHLSSSQQSKPEVCSSPKPIPLQKCQDYMSNTVVRCFLVLIRLMFNIELDNFSHQSYPVYIPLIEKLVDYKRLRYGNDAATMQPCCGNYTATNRPLTGY